MKKYVLILIAILFSLTAFASYEAELYSSETEISFVSVDGEETLFGNSCSAPGHDYSCYYRHADGIQRRHSYSDAGCSVSCRADENAICKSARCPGVPSSCGCSKR